MKKMHPLTKKNLEASKKIIQAINENYPFDDKDKLSDRDTVLLPEYSDGGELEEWESAEILLPYAKLYNDEKFQTIAGRSLRDHAANEDILVYFFYSSKRDADKKHKDFSNLYPRTPKGVSINIYKELDSQYRKKIYDEISEKPEYKEYDEAKFQKFKEKYTCDYLDDPNGEFKTYDLFLEKIVAKAKEIQKVERKEQEEKEYKIVENMSVFLKKYGIFLLIEDKRDILDGVCGYVGEKKMPTIVLYIDKDDTKHLRRSMFTIAHELYHLLYNEGEELANKFAGALLTSNYFDDKDKLGDITDIDSTQALLMGYFKDLKVSFECIINTLFNSRMIKNNQRYMLLRDKRRYMDTEFINLNTEKAWIHKSLGLIE